jgi:hypothetical protein
VSCPEVSRGRPNRPAQRNDTAIARRPIDRPSVVAVVPRLSLRASAPSIVRHVCWVPLYGGVGQCVASGGVLAFLIFFAVPAAGQTPTSVCPPPASSEHAAPGSLPPVDLLNPAPDQIVACVGSQSITGATFSHWAVVTRKSEDSLKRFLLTGEVIEQVMGFLVSSKWVLGEAANLNIHVTKGEVRHAFARARAEEFPKQNTFKAFLRESGETVSDLLFRVRLKLLSQRIQRDVLRSHRGAGNRQRALERFVHAFTRRWEAQTYCDPAYAVETCGHVLFAP